VEDQVHDTVLQLTQRKLLLPCDRKFKKPKPGRTQLVKWPRSLDGVQVGGMRHHAARELHLRYSAASIRLLQPPVQTANPAPLTPPPHPPPPPG
jgi:hypothetical protein